VNHLIWNKQLHDLHSLSISTMRLHTDDIVGSIPLTHRWGRSLLVLVFSSMHCRYWQVSIQCKCQWVSPLCICTGRWGRSNANCSGFLLCTLSSLEGGVEQCSRQLVWEMVYFLGVWCHSVFYV
jgi:hypothetical protein